MRPQRPEQGKGPVRIWTDGNCRLCRSSRRWCELRDLNRQLEFIDFRSANSQDLPVERSHLERSMWVRGEDGGLAEGFEGWRRILLQLPRWRVLARISGIPPLRWLGPVVYRLVADNRYSLRLN